jgi:hypothetical protein
MVGGSFVMNGGEEEEERDGHSVPSESYNKAGGLRISTPKGEEAFSQQIYLLVADFLSRTGHQSVAKTLLQQCNDTMTYNWEGNPLFASPANLVSTV